MIAGVPEDLAGDEPSEYDAILADARMQEVVSPVMTEQLVPSCNVPGRGIAFPPRRLVQVASGLDALGVQTDVQSICRDSFAPSTAALIAAIARASAACEE